MDPLLIQEGHGSSPKCLTYRIEKPLSLCKVPQKDKPSLLPPATRVYFQHMQTICRHAQRIYYLEIR